ncbi:MAG: hypothetical protein N3A69_03495, partial [Leptospiraceae bacterium]|nr:hypothetical protein [Leptospiraceae bacterium]
IKRWVMERVKFKCKERNGRVIDEGVYFEFDLVKIGAKIYRSFIAYSEHYDKERTFNLLSKRINKVGEAKK